MKSALKKSVVSTSISLILASGMAAFAAHAADDVKLKATKTNVAFSDFTPTEYSTKGKPNIIVLRPWMILVMDNFLLIRDLLTQKQWKIVKLSIPTK
ncbi:hypothetical protein AB2E77_04565 [Escherichia coli]